MKNPSPQEVADRFAIRVAARAARGSGHSVRTASASRVRAEITTEVLESFGEAVRIPGRRIEAGFLTKRMRELWEIFQRAPREWERFKAMLDIQATGILGVTKELMSKIPRMLKEGKKWMTKLGERLRNLPVVSLYFDVARKMPSVTSLLGKLMTVLPEPVTKALHNIHSKARTFADFLDGVFKKHRALAVAGTLLSAAIFAVIWFNVIEISWDLPEIIRGFLGMYTFSELLQSLPESALGFVLILMFPGISVKLIIKALLPATIALRVLYLVQREYLEYDPGKGLRIRWDKMPKGKPEGAPEIVSL